ncbi:MAG TPA: malto-oligosyltrehalose trehalohydrolase, partial [Thermoanaerobaculia bacterium]|nr:malto-oligosyltrehalose trehalohydrolase [Thermoanaerobaculia bacterium]
ARSSRVHRRRTVGAEVVRDGVHFRVWAPSRQRVAVVIDERDYALEAQGGWFEGLVADARDGTLYRFRLDDEREAYPDPASRFQPDGPHGPSQVVDASKYAWRDRDFVLPRNRVLYELHIGTFTREGTYAAAAQRLASLAELGINVVELMPVNEFAGAFGWGYDGVDLFAPTHLYGTPDDLRDFISAAHTHGIAVILDVVYNHFGPDGCYVSKFTPDYFTDRYANEWGDALNFDGDRCEGVRELIAENAAYWIDEFHFDGLRIDATQSIHDASEKHILAEIAERGRKAAGGRAIFITAENEPQNRRLLTDYGMDALWNDDWHHAARVALTGLREAYYADYRGTPQQFVSMARRGFLYQGQWYAWQKKRRGTRSDDIASERLICFLENHDQVANSGDGARLRDLTSPGKLRAMTALLLLQPQTPLLFQGQERGARAPFLYFADHDRELAEKVAKGRSDFLKQFPSLKHADFDAPHDRATFEKCKLDDDDRDESIVALYRELLQLRREHLFDEDLEGAVLNEHSFLLRSRDHLLLINLSDAFDIDVFDEPLLAGTWRVRWSSEKDAGDFAEDAWRVPAECAVLLAVQ